MDFPEIVVDSNSKTTFQKGEISKQVGTRPDLFSLANEDLRFSPHRGEVFRLMDEDPDRSYFDWASELGQNPDRLWT